MSFLDDYGVNINWPLRRVVRWIVWSGVGIIGVSVLLTFAEKNDSGFYQVRRHEVFGDLYVRYDAGWYYNGLCDVTTYQVETSYTFSSEKHEERVVGPAIKVRFNDGGEGFISGDFRFQLPANDEDMIRVHEIFGGPDALMRELYIPLINEVVFKSSQLLSSEESYTNKARFAQLTVDQLENGIYETEEYLIISVDSATGKTDVQKKVRIKRDENGAPARLSGIPSLKAYNIQVTQNVIREPSYGKNITDLISEKRKFENDIAVAEADAEKANQQKLTVIANGKKRVTEAQYAAKQVMAEKVEGAKKDKTVAVIRAEQRLEVSKQQYLVAQRQADGKILQITGEAEKRRKVKQADNALLARTEAFQEIIGYYQGAFTKVSWSPRIATVSALTGRDGLPPAFNSFNKVAELVMKDLGLTLTF